MAFFGVLAWPISIILKLLYNAIGSYGLAIIILTIVIRCLLFPLTWKQMKSQKQMQLLQPRIKEIEKKHKGNKQALQQETMDLYKQENVSMTGGCLPMVIQLFVIMGLYQAIYRPLYYMYKLSEDQITALRAVFGLEDNVRNETTLASLIQQNPDSMKGIVDGFESIRFVDFNFLGMNLANAPAPPNFTDFASFVGSADKLWIIPIIALITGIFSAYMSRKMMPSNVDDNPMAAQTAKMGKMMMWVMPIMSLYFAFVLPSAIGLYWSVANLMAGLQQVLIAHKLKNANFELTKVKEDPLMEKPTRKERREQRSAGTAAVTNQKKKAPAQGQKRPEGQRPRPAGQRPAPKADGADNKAGENTPPTRPAGQRPAGQRPPGQRPAGQRPPGQRPVGGRPIGKRPSEAAKPQDAAENNDSQNNAKGGETADD